MLAILNKYSDLLELYSAVECYRPTELTFAYIPGVRTSQNSLASMIAAWPLDNCEISYVERATHRELAEVILDASPRQNQVCAPFIRFRELWSTVPNLRKAKIRTTHLSESLPDTFGHLGYRLGYRGRSAHSLLSLPYFKIRALRCMPDGCFFPCAPEIHNPFVKKTHQTSMPPLGSEQQNRIIELLGGKARPILIGGFGYDNGKMARHLGLSSYVATSKSREIIVDGVHIPLETHLCAEEILLAGVVSKVVSYTSTAVVWAKRWYPDLEISCYRASALDRKYGPIFSLLAARALRKMGVTVQPECRAMLADRD